MNVLYAITGCIAAYKAPLLIRGLIGCGHEVRCVLTANGARLVSRHALATLSDHPVASDLWHDDGRIEHIDLSRWADCLLVAPATANILAKFAHGLADDLLSTLFLSLEPTKPVFLAPAMNTVMWDKPVVQHNLTQLREAGCIVIGPVGGELACGESGIGAMSAPADIVSTVDQSTC